MQKSVLLGSSLTTQRKLYANLVGAALSLEIAAQYAQQNSPLVLICAKVSDATKLEQELHFLCPHKEIYVFRDYETLPYDMLSAHQDIISSRLEFLATAPFLKDGIIITSINAMMQRLPPQNYIQKYAFTLKQGDLSSIESLKHRFVERGYLQVENVLSHGEFAVRGSILDVFPMGSSDPLRIDFFDDEVESISYFDVQNQRSTQKIKEVKLLPAHEFPLDNDSIAIFRSNYRNSFINSSYQNHIIYQAISKGVIPAGIEYYLPLFFSQCDTFFDFIPTNASFILVGDINQAIHDYDVELHQRASMIAGNQEHPPLPVYSVFLSEEEFNQALRGKKQAIFREAALTKVEQSLRLTYDLPCVEVPPIAFDHHLQNSASLLEEFIRDFCNKQHGRILITALSEGRRQSLRELIPFALTKEFTFKAASNIDEFFSSEAQIMTTIAPFDKGVLFSSQKQKFAILTETELLGFKVVRQRKRSQSGHQQDQDAIIKNLAQLTEGQIVVHIDHGIGQYRGLKTQTINGITGEYLTIAYQNGDLLSIPITALNKVARYSGVENPTLSRLGSDSWDKKKQKAAQKVYDVAAELLDIYAQRKLKTGFAFTVDEHALDEFTSNFPYEETEDQQKAIEQTLLDMQKPLAMDRLVCGDVGFGKTEVALRAAFVAASNGKQVAVLTPTTILAEQHYQNFKERFAVTAINVEMLSRFKSPKEQTKIIDALEQGQIDIIIGTHRLLSNKLKFKDLGLLIIDEEHRFGVKQKESLKALRAEVDLLTLTATPIPRTLNMAMEGMRELSIIATPPEHRLAVKTFIHENSDQLCREAVLRELRRGGQVYYLHNDVATMQLKYEQLSKLVPEAKIEIAHGQMNEIALQKVMKDFYHKRFNLLLCSTIIENGLDIPTANTIIIERADLLGLAQLHQIRGRVGRSHHQAYAYFFTPPKKLLTKDAERRLEAISSIDELGAGFVLASHDLEIRGAGELLGEDQSGQIESIGFSLYMEMLNAAVKALQNGEQPSLASLTANECDIDMHISALLPDEYIYNVNTRLSIYKRLASCETEDQFEDLKIELIDRFGFLPVATENLFLLSKLKRLATLLGITKIRGDETGATLEFSENHKVDPAYIMLLLQKSKHNEYRILRENVLRYNLPESEKNPRLHLLRSVLRALSAHSSLNPQNHKAQQ